MAYILSCCSTADLTHEHFDERNIKFVCFHFSLNGIEYLDDLGESVPFKKFYHMMANGAETKTSQVSITEYIDHFTPYLEAGLDVLHVCLSSGLSGTYSAATNAAKIAQERYPERKIYIIDSLAASSGYGLLMDKIADKRDEGMNINELRNWIESNKLRLHHWFFSTDLSFYVKGGRISKASGAVGTLLKICPLLNMDSAGRLVPVAKVRSKTRVIKEIEKRMEENAEGELDYSGKCYISNSDCIEDAKAVAELVEETFKKLNGKVEIYSVGTTIGSHTGPGTVALFFWGAPRCH